MKWIVHTAIYIFLASANAFAGWNNVAWPSTNAQPRLPPGTTYFASNVIFIIERQEYNYQSNTNYIPPDQSTGYDGNPTSGVHVFSMEVTISAIPDLSETYANTWEDRDALETTNVYVVGVVTTRCVKRVDYYWIKKTIPLEVREIWIYELYKAITEREMALLSDHEDDEETPNLPYDQSWDEYKPNLYRPLSEWLQTFKRWVESRAGFYINPANEPYFAEIVKASACIEDEQFFPRYTTASILEVAGVTSDYFSVTGKPRNLREEVHDAWKICNALYLTGPRRGNIEKSTKWTVSQGEHCEILPGPPISDPSGIPFHWFEKAHEMALKAAQVQARQETNRATVGLREMMWIREDTHAMLHGAVAEWRGIPHRVDGWGMVDIATSTEAELKYRFQNTRKPIVADLVVYSSFGSSGYAAGVAPRCEEAETSPPGVYDRLNGERWINCTNLTDYLVSRSSAGSSAGTNKYTSVVLPLQPQPYGQIGDDLGARVDNCFLFPYWVFDNSENTFIGTGWDGCDHPEPVLWYGQALRADVTQEVGRYCGVMLDWRAEGGFKFLLTP